ncbi:MAG TPA: SLC13 family permease [Tepidisphaeraceae bacterium]|jgi:Na+/H+ antiporter NhaD/arsenite permease-like protein|nr:SLC13 family permease [Tepidisphaeraceae bacterium]
MLKVGKFFGLLIGTILLLLLLRGTRVLVFDFRQILSIGIFSMFIYGTLLFGEFRLAFAFGGIALLMACSLLTVERFTQAASLDVLVFLIGTFLVIGYLEEYQFFEHVVSAIMGAVGPRPEALLLIMMVVASIASALVGEVTAILFMAGAALHLTGKYKLNPVPFVIMLVFACNNGSAMSSVGNPIGVLIALKTGLGFTDFLKYAAPIAIVVDVATFAICRWWFADAFVAFGKAVRREFAIAARSVPAPTVMVGGGDSGGGGFAEESGDTGATEDALEGAAGQPAVMSETFYAPQSGETRQEQRRAFRRCWIILAALILLLVTHKQTESWLGRMFHCPLVDPSGEVVHAPDGAVVYGLREGTMMVAAALVMGGIVLLLEREKARELVERRVDWWTLSFFMMLFASVGTLQDTGVTEVIAGKLSGMGGGHVAVIQTIGWATGWLSAFLDNVLAVATFMPVVHDIRMKAGVPYSSAIYWFMLFGGTFMGNMTLIGSTANIVATGLLERRGHGTVGFGYWMKIGFIVAIVSMVVATLLLQVESHWLPMMQAPR